MGNIEAEKVLRVLEEKEERMETRKHISDIRSVAE